jgi:20S proteasome subunit beta 3
MPHPKCMVAFTGLEGDIQSLSQELSIQVTSKQNRGFMTHTKKRQISPQAMAMLMSHVLYARRQAPYYVEPVLVGLLESGKPFLCSYDLIGAQSRSEAFCVAGVASKSLYGTAEALWRPNLNSEDLAQVCGKAFLSALERDCLSGYGAIVYLITRDGVVENDLACRND